MLTSHTGDGRKWIRLTLRPLAETLRVSDAGSAKSEKRTLEDSQPERKSVVMTYRDKKKLH